MTKFRNFKCVIGEIPFSPNKLTYIPLLSETGNSHWVGFCSGDKAHKEHFIIIHKGRDRNTVRWKSLTNFNRPKNKTLIKRLFPRQERLRCPEGKCYMKLRDRYDEITNLDNVDIYECLGNLHGGGHFRHYVRIEHGLLDTPINGKPVPALLVIIEKTSSN